MSNPTKPNTRCPTEHVMSNRACNVEATVAGCGSDDQCPDGYHCAADHMCRGDSGKVKTKSGVVDKSQNQVLDDVNFHVRCPFAP